MAGDNGDNQRCADTSKAIKLEVVLDTDTAAGHTSGVTKGGEWARRQQEVVGNNFYIDVCPYSDKRLTCASSFVDNSYLYLFFSEFLFFLTRTRRFVGALS